jgi:DNA-nicking Smr family endonuclease
MRRRPREPSAAERDLWRTVTKDVKPLPGVVPEPAPPPPAPAPEPAAAAAADPPIPPGAGTPARARPKPPALPPLAPLEPKTRRRVARGQLPVDARLDLHGLTQHEAHDALLRFLRRAQASGAAVVIVITGKGGAKGRAGDGPHWETSAERGILRRMVPLWLRLPELRPYVVGFEEAAPGHGGEGALYVRVRRAKGRSPP